MTADDAEARIRKMLPSLWEQFSHLTDERLATLGGAVEAARSGSLGAVEQAEAGRTAHTLAGSLGMFGLDDASDAARRMEAVLLDGGPAGPDQAGDLHERLSVIRQAVEAGPNFE